MVAAAPAAEKGECTTCLFPSLIDLSELVERMLTSTQMLQCSVPCDAFCAAMHA